MGCTIEARVNTGGAEDFLRVGGVDKDVLFSSLLVVTVRGM